MLPGGCSGMELHQRTIAAGVAAVPGKPFFADNIENDRGLRMNFSVPSLEEIDEGVARMGAVLRDFLQ